MIIIVAGVSGSGKTTVGLALADALQWKFADADVYHPEANVEKMARGEGLTDADREPWLARLAGLIAGWAANGTNAVLACSSLKKAYRDRLLGAAPNHEAKLVFLKASPDLLLHRMQARVGHYAKVDLLPSQLAALEEPLADEALILDASKTPTALASDIRQGLGLG